jgi:quinol monooxygenase YgiN
VSTLVLIAGFQARPGQEERLRTALEGMIEPSLEEPGCLAYQPYADPNRSGSMILVEEWADESALEAHFRSPHFEHVAEVLDRVLAQPFTLRRLAAVPTG